uniref:Uncharacterized protein n=1 Tax=Phlebotomus papatasi TaxID=29031 RepID=A0A1B0DHA4_PHLPP
MRSLLVGIGGLATDCGAAAWTISEYQTYPTTGQPAGPPTKGHDRMSLCSSHTGSSSNSEYSVPRSTYGPDGTWCEHNGPPRPPKPKSLQKPPMPLPLSSPAGAHVGPYENYDVPRTPVALDADNYDTPKKIHEYLAADVNSNPSGGSYANYDIPATVGKMCGCLGKSNSGAKTLERDRADCTCTKVMSWADNWITLPYCRRGNTIENTGVPISRVKLSGEGKMPVMQPSGELAIYATVDMAKKLSRRMAEKCECVPDDVSESSSSNYINLDPSREPTGQPTDTNYTNMDFAQSLEHYENSRNVLERAGICPEDDEEAPKICHKCGHTAGKLTDSGAKTPGNEAKTPLESLLRAISFTFAHHCGRYGVVDNRFCFEGGSQCGKGEGLYVLVTDQGDEITHTLKVASQGKLATKRRPVARKLSALDSPRKLSPRPVEDGVSLSANHHFHTEENNCICSSRTSFWPSQESRDLDSNYGCGDTVSVSEAHDALGDGDMFPGRSTMAHIERCMSCISKLGAPSMSRSSTAAGTPGLASI